MTPIEATRIEKSFGTTPVLRGVSLEVASGSIYGLLGRNGAGKTTLLKILIGLIHADSGEGRVLGARLASERPREKERVAYVAQGDFLPQWARIKDLIRFDAALRPKWDASRLDRWLHSVGISDKRRVDKLSVGQRKRFELELAMAGRPDALLLDEPFAGVDPVSRIELIEALLGHVAEKEATILMSSHIIGDLERLCDRIGILADGVIAFEDELDALRERGENLEEVGIALMRSTAMEGKLP